MSLFFFYLVFVDHLLSGIVLEECWIQGYTNLSGYRQYFHREQSVVQAVNSGNTLLLYISFSPSPNQNINRATVGCFNGSAKSTLNKENLLP